MSPLVILLIGVVAVIAMIIVLRVNAFIALIGAALLVSLLAPGPLAGKATRVAGAFGSVCGGIGIVIALAAVIGKCLMDSGAADRIVRSFLKLLGEKRASWALMGSGFVLSIPVFFDTVFYLLVPLARSLWRRTHKNYILYVTAIVAGAGIAHTLIPPTPGPLYMAAAFKIDIGLMILIGVLVGLPTSVVGLLACKVINRFRDLPMRPYAGQTEPEPPADEQLPPLWLSLLPVVLPVILIAANTVTKTMADAAHKSLLEQGRILQWSGVCTQLANVGTDSETGPARYFHECLPAEVRQSLAAADSQAIDADLEAAVQETFSQLADKETFLLAPAFLGVGLSGDAQRLLDDVVRRLPQEQADRFKKHFRRQAVDGMITASRGRDMLAEIASKFSQEQRTRLNWLVLEEAFRGQVRRTLRQRAAGATAVIGNPNLALFLSALVAMFTLVHSRGLSLKELAKTTEVALMSGGIIILITAGGGAFGAMLRDAGIQKSVQGLVGTGQQNVGAMILVLAFAVAVLIKFAQGSGTVSMITTASMFAAMGLSPEVLGCNPVYLAMAIGSGSLVGDWMNNSGFWIFSRMSVLTETETLTSWTILTASLGLTGLGFTLLFAKLIPML